MIFDFRRIGFVAIAILTIWCVAACRISNTDRTIADDGLIQPVVFSSCCRGPRGGCRIGLSMCGEYMGYEFNRTNYFTNTGAVVSEKSDKYDVIVKRLSAKHLRYFDSVELWHLRPTHRLFKLVFQGEPAGGLSEPECHKLYQSITNELDYCFDVKMSKCSPSMTTNLLYDVEGAIPGFKFSASISKMKYRMSITALKVLVPPKKITAPFFDDDVKVETNGL